MHPQTVGIAEIAARLAETPGVLTALCHGWNDQLWNVTEGPGTWSAREVLCHLLHGEDDDWIPRMALILENGGREPFRPFDREKGFAAYGHESPARLLALFADKRTQSLRALDRWPIDEAAMGATGIHPEFGAVTLEQLLATWVTHDFAHILQIARVAEKHYGQWVGPWRAYFSALRAVG
jgi:hypothetical protein